MRFLLKSFLSASTRNDLELIDPSNNSIDESKPEIIVNAGQNKDRYVAKNQYSSYCGVFQLKDDQSLEKCKYNFK